MPAVHFLMTGRFQLNRQKRGRVPFQGGGQTCLQGKLHEGHQQGQQQQHQHSPTDNYHPIPHLKVLDCCQFVFSDFPVPRCRPQ